MKKNIYYITCFLIILIYSVKSAELTGQNPAVNPAYMPAQIPGSFPAYTPAQNSASFPAFMQAQNPAMFQMFAPVQDSTPFSTLTAGKERGSYPNRFNNINDVLNLIYKYYSPQETFVDKIKNSIIITETTEKLDKIEEFLISYDAPPKVILVEGTILKVNLTDVFNLSSKFSKLYDRAWKAKDPLTGNITDKDFTSKISTNFLNATTVSEENFFFEFVTAGGSTLKWGLSTLITKGIAEVILKPHISFVSGTTGSFEKNDNLPQFSSSIANGVTITNVNMVKVGLSLIVAASVIPPTIPGQKFKINIQSLKITDGSGGQKITSGAVEAFSTQETILSTTQMVDDGELIILGGSIDKSKTNTLNKLPLLGDIPVIKYLFRSSEKNESIKETIAFLRLSVIKDKSYESKSAQYTLSKKLQPIEYGGEVNDSIHEHPWRTPKWSSKLIYDNGLYFNLVSNKISNDKQEQIITQFKDKIRTRLSLMTEWNDYKLVEKIILNDNGLENILRQMSKDFDVEPNVIMIIARHIGLIGDEIFSIYNDYLKLHNLKMKIK